MLPERENENIKYFIPQVEIEPTTIGLHAGASALWRPNFSN